MKHCAFLVAAGLLATVTGAQAQVMDKKSMDSKMMAPTMEQCQGGYKRTYKSSMNWSKRKFKRACRTMMMKNKM